MVFWQVCVLLFLNYEGKALKEGSRQEAQAGRPAEGRQRKNTEPTSNVHWLKLCDDSSEIRGSESALRHGCEKSVGMG